MRLSGKVALITGGGAGIGKACAALFAREGGAVMIAERDAGAGAATCAAIRDGGGAAEWIATDVSRPEEVERAVEATVRRFGGLDILYSNVGGSTLQDGSVVDAGFDEFRNKINVDLFGTWLGARYAVPAMIARGGGSIINASSICALRGLPGKAAYTAAKGAITSLTISMALDLARHNIRVNAIAPGATLTERVMARQGGADGARSAINDRHLLGLLEPIDVAYAVLYLASDESRRTTGQVIAVDSGYTIS